MAVRLRQFAAVTAIAALIGTPGVLSACVAVCGGGARAANVPAGQAAPHCAASAAAPAAQAHAGAGSHHWRSPVGGADRLSARHGECCALRVQTSPMASVRSEPTASPVLTPLSVGDAFAPAEPPPRIHPVPPVNGAVAAAPRVLRI